MTTPARIRVVQPAHGFTVGDRDLLRAALAAQRVLSELLSAPLRRPSHVPHEPLLGTCLSSGDIPDAGLELSSTVGVCSAAPTASRTRRRRGRPAFAADA